MTYLLNEPADSQVSHIIWGFHNVCIDEASFYNGAEKSIILIDLKLTINNTVVILYKRHQKLTKTVYLSLGDLRLSYLIQTTSLTSPWW